LSLPSRGLLDAPDLLPCLGVDALDDGPAALAGACQLYGRERDAWAVLHVRSPAAPGRAAAAAESLAAWARTAGVRGLLVLGSVDARARQGGAGGGAGGGLVHRAVPEGGEGGGAGPLEAAATAAGSTRLPDVPGDPPFAAGRLPPWPLLRACEGAAASGGAAADGSAAPLPALALLVYASEGDNAGDAVALVKGAAAVLGVDGQTEWRAPRSWGAAFGRGGGGGGSEM
jgi:hypothetical protein